MSRYFPFFSIKIINGFWNLKASSQFFSKDFNLRQNIGDKYWKSSNIFFCEMLWKLFFGNFVAELSTLWSLVVNCGLAFNSKNYGDFFEVQPLRKTLATQVISSEVIELRSELITSLTPLTDLKKCSIHRLLQSQSD